MKSNVSVGKSFTLLYNSDNNGFFQQLIVLYIEHFRWYRSFPPALQCFTLLYVIQLRWYRISPLYIITKSLRRVSNLLPSDLESDAYPMSHNHSLVTNKKLHYKIEIRMHNYKTCTLYNAQCTCIQGINRYCLQVGLSATRKVKLAAYLILNSFWFVL